MKEKRILFTSDKLTHKHLFKGMLYPSEFVTFVFILNTLETVKRIIKNSEIAILLKEKERGVIVKSELTRKCDQ